ncbi:MAG TPA: cell wall-binding repeat-containing protein [Candidatus Sulfotelmatobacter sp.]|nr:cell wall-binding repeat-containing protein [Candidatus Sulfotelmatobacter sp.]
MTIARRLAVPGALALVLAVSCLAVPVGGVRPAAAASGTMTPLAAEGHELDLLNGQRAAVGLAPVSMDPRLEAIAEQRSMNMATLHYFSHTEPDGSTALSMIEAAGISWSRMGEIIEWNAGYGSWGPSADEAATDWHDSPPHYAIITTADYTAAGIGVAYDATSGRTYWTGIFIQGPPPPPPPPPPVDPDRIAGIDRYATSAATSASNFSPGVSVVYVGSGQAFPDALSGAAAAAKAGGPVLLVQNGLLPMSTAAELARLQPGRIVLLGSTGAVDTPVMDLLQGYTSGTVTRLAGSDRYATAAAVSRATFAALPAAVYIASGLNFPDALAGAAAAAHVGAPILLVNGGVPSSTVTELKRLVPGHIFVLGGAASVSQAVENALVQYTATRTSASVTRLGGADRWATAVDIAEATYSTGDTLYIANGENFPDALAGAPLGGPLLLVPSGDVVPQVVLDEVARLAPPSLVVLGGPSGVSDAADAALHAAAGLPWP